MKRLYIFIVFALIATMILAACATGPGAPVPTEQPTNPPTENPPTPVETEAPVPQAVAAARQMLAEMLKIDPSAITVSKITEQDFSDSCLGLGGPAESCLQVVTPGFVVDMTAGGVSYTFHASADGSVIRMAKPEALAAARQALAALLKIDVSKITVANVTPQDFSDSCLGLGGPAESCLQAITPGYVVDMKAGGMDYTFHASKDGSVIRLAKPEAVRAAVQALATLLGIGTNEITINQITQKDFSNGCLDIVIPGVMCTDVITPGFVVDMTAAGTRYVYHTNMDGSVVMQEQTGPSTGLPIKGADPIVRAAIEFLASQLQISNETIMLVSKESVDWPDACLGIHEAGVGCATVITPGYKIVLEYNGKQYVVHTDLTGTNIALEKSSNN